MIPHSIRSVLFGILGGVFVLVAYIYFVPSGAHVAAEGAISGTYARRTASDYATAPEDFRRASKRSMAGVVHISTREEQPLTMWDFYYGRQSRVREGTGSGVIYSADGYIVTNNHVIDGAQEISVSLNDNRKFNARLVGVYPEADIAVLKIDGADLPSLRFANSDEVEVGDWVLAVGNPYNLSSTVTAGIVSARGRDINIINARNAIESFIQTDAAINPGNSGGALVNNVGEVIGINTAIYTRSGGYSGYGFAIPANLAANIVEDIIATGSYRQVVLGIDASELDEAYALELGAPVTQGVVIEEVEAGGLAAEAGIAAGDIVVAANGRPVRSIAEFREAVSSRMRGRRLPLGIIRGAERLELTLQL